MMFINLINAYDKVPREVSLLRCLEPRGVFVAYIKAIEDMYNDFKTTMYKYHQSTLNTSWSRQSCIKDRPLASICICLSDGQIDATYSREYVLVYVIHKCHNIDR